MDLGTCAARPEWAGRRVRAGIVVLGDGEWGLAITSVLPAMQGGDHSGLAHCIETALRNGPLGDGLPLPPPTAFVVVGELDVPSSAVLASAITARLDAARSAFDACVRARAAAALTRIEVAARIEVRGGRVEAIGSRSAADPWSELAMCWSDALVDVTDLPDGAAVVAATVTRAPAPPGTLPRHDGSEGAVCAWGERHQTGQAGEYVVPEPRACRAGLACCYGGGIPGLSSSCMRVGRRRCPAFP
ncbi:MAG: hypothetical protein M3Y87_09090 [Myxococcota bacterium]|nr:hypothetical protein [Myxococcota bacterium]